MALLATDEYSKARKYEGNDIVIDNIGLSFIHVYHGEMMQYIIC
jgi:hypothetical protein